MTQHSKEELVWETVLQAFDERLLIWLRLARPLLPLPETDRLYGELLKLEQLALQPLSDEALVERSAQAHTVWTLKAWKPLLK